ncbi:MAG: hypothetical protein ACRDJN_17930 [Chloroflexota bacterium]
MARRYPTPLVAEVILKQLRAALLLFEQWCQCDDRWCDRCILRRQVEEVAGHLERMARER